MNKTVSHILVIVNAIVVVFLIIASCVMLFMANTEQKNLFGYEVKIVTKDKTDDEVNEKCLVLLKDNPVNSIVKGNQILYTFDYISYIITVIDKNGNMIFYNDRLGNSQTFDITTVEYGGIVTFSSEFGGNLLFSIAKSGNISLQIIFIFGIFVISLLTLFIIYTIYLKKQIENGNQQLEFQEAMQVFDESLSRKFDEEYDYKFQAERLMAPTQDQPDFLEPIQERAEVEKVEEPVCNMAHRLEFFSVKSEETPSIDSLMNFIDSLDEKSEDDDIKLFDPKHIE